MFPASGRQLASWCGISPGALSEWLSRFDFRSAAKRDRVLAGLLIKHGHEGPLFEVSGPRATHLHSRSACFAVLEYYAFEAPRRSSQAVTNFRQLLGSSESMETLQVRPTSGYRRGHVYFIRCEATGAVKIGFSANPSKRLGSLQIGASTPLVMVASIPGSEGDERALHRKYASKRLRGEWFSLTEHDVTSETTATIRSP